MPVSRTVSRRIITAIIFLLRVDLVHGEDQCLIPRGLGHSRTRYSISKSLLVSCLLSPIRKNGRPHWPCPTSFSPTSLSVSFATVSKTHVPPNVYPSRRAMHRTS